MTLDEFIELYGYTKCNINNGSWVRIGPQIVELLHKFDNNRLNLVRKGRQIGFTTALKLYSLYLALKDNQPKNIIYYGRNSGMTQRFISDIKDLLGHLVMEDSDIIRGTSRNVIKFTNNNTIKGICNIYNLKGEEQIDTIMFDEYAFLTNIESLLPTAAVYMTPESKIIIGSTPNGQNMFYDLWVRNNMNMEKTFIRTTDIDRFSSQRWIEDQRRHISDKQFDVEVLGTFVDKDGNWLIDERDNRIRIKYNIKKHKLNGNK